MTPMSVLWTEIEANISCLSSNGVLWFVGKFSVIMKLCLFDKIHLNNPRYKKISFISDDISKRFCSEKVFYFKMICICNLFLGILFNIQSSLVRLHGGKQGHITDTPFFSHSNSFENQVPSISSIGTPSSVWLLDKYCTPFFSHSNSFENQVPSISSIGTPSSVWLLDKYCRVQDSSSNNAHNMDPLLHIDL